MKETTIITAMPPREIGSTTEKKTRARCAPSMKAASSSSTGISLKTDRSMMIEKAIVWVALAMITGGGNVRRVVVKVGSGANPRPNEVSND